MFYLFLSSSVNVIMYIFLHVRVIEKVSVRRVNVDDLNAALTVLIAYCRL